jgi:hypothetical protein
MVYLTFLNTERLFTGLGLPASEGLLEIPHAFVSGVTGVLRNQPRIRAALARAGMPVPPNRPLWRGKGSKKSRNEGGSHDVVDNKGPILGTHDVFETKQVLEVPFWARTQPSVSDSRGSLRPKRNTYDRSLRLLWNQHRQKTKPSSF